MPQCETSTHLLSKPTTSTLASSATRPVMDNLLLMIQWLLRFLVFLLWCLTGPILNLQYFRKRKRLPPIRNKLLQLSGTELARRIRNRETSCEEVVRSFIERCKAVNPIVNAIVDVRFVAAMQEAKEYDTFLRTTEKTKEELAEDLPLLGIPITVKQSIAVKGMSHSVGLKNEQEICAEEDAPVIRQIRKAGGIIILVSNTPELCFFWETYNNVTGITFNPYDNRRVAGGSSGGEAALLGSGASILGVVSDIAGSARLPAMFCGVFGHKPSPRWVPWEGHRPESQVDEWPDYFTLGNMARYAEDLPLLLKVMATSPEIRKSFGQQVSVKDLKVFYLDHDGSKVAHPMDPEIILASRKLKEHMERTYHMKVQQATLNGMEFAFDSSTYTILRMNGVESVYSKSGNQTWSSMSLELLKYICCMSSYTAHGLLYGVVKGFADKMPQKHQNMLVKKGTLLKKEFQDLLGTNGVLIYPGFRSSAYYPFETFYNSVNFHHMTIFNALGLPVTQCPLGLDRKGLPIGVQIVANVGCDHLSLAMAQEIQRVFGGWQEPSAERTV